MNADKENTFRMLRDEELFVTFWGCRFGLHKWLKYRDPEMVREGMYGLIVQDRSCGSCNKHNRRVIRKW
jgi:hypothetical protein